MNRQLMVFLRVVLALFACAATIGCATPPPREPRTTVVLLPDEDGIVGSVVVNTKAGSQFVDRAFTATTVDSAALAPGKLVNLGRDRVESDYKRLMNAQPSKPANFTLNFLLDTTLLTDESKATLPALIEAVRARSPTAITVFGHTDSSGSETRNSKLAAERAKVVAVLLKKLDPSLGPIELLSFGDKHPLIPTRQGATEPRNRRAEVLIL
jgi:outer membrane protein OmpA-like peptidoglycan-associated protein